VAFTVDDALALLMLLHLPKEDVELLGITTTYGYTQVRRGPHRRCQLQPTDDHEATGVLG
jgi:inosine-uridine nucleoside N-ribohydrolase